MSSTLPSAGRSSGRNDCVFRHSEPLLKSRLVVTRYQVGSPSRRFAQIVARTLPSRISWLGWLFFSIHLHRFVFVKPERGKIPANGV